MALIGVFFQGMEMFTDIGIGPSIIQNKRGDQPKFYNTAWTIQIIRGILLWCVSCVLAWPLAMIYGEPLLFSLIPAAGLCAVAAGFNSTKIQTAKRHLNLRDLAVLNLTCQVISISVTVFFAWHLRSVWALVFGGLAGSSVKALLSQLALRGPLNRFCWQRESIEQLFSFGRWIFLTTAFSFVTRQADKLILGGLISKSELGVYAVAMVLVEAGTGLIAKLASQVALPSLSTVARDQPERLREVLYRIRRPVEWITLPAAGFLMVTGSIIVEILYDPRYLQAGWMVQALAPGIAFGPIASVGMKSIIAVGYPRYDATLQFIRAVFLVISVPLFYSFFGMSGAVVAVSVNLCLGYPMVLVVLSKLGLLRLKSELRLILPFAVGIGLGIVVNYIALA